MSGTTLALPPAEGRSDVGASTSGWIVANPIGSEEFGNLPEADPPAQPPPAQQPPATPPTPPSSESRVGEKNMETIDRILNCGSDYYRILGLPRNCTLNDVNTAYRGLVRLIHPDQLPAKYAKIAGKAFNAVKEARSVLGNSNKKEMYDTHGAGFKEAGQGGAAVFCPPHPEDDIGGSDTDYSDTEDLHFRTVKANEIADPGEARKAIWNDATPHMETLLRRPNDENSIARLSILNARIQALNEIDRLTPDQFKIPWEMYNSQSEAVQFVFSKYSGNLVSKDEASRDFENMKDVLRVHNEKHGYPSDWCCYGEPPWKTVKTSRNNKGNGRTVKTPRNNNVQLITGDVGLKAESIVAHMPLCTRGMVLGYQLYVLYSPNYPTRLASLLPTQVIDAKQEEYHNQGEKIDVRISAKRYTQGDASNVTGIFGIASSLWHTRGSRAPTTYIGVQFQDGERTWVDVITRTVLRSIFTNMIADRLIDEYYTELGVTPPWQRQPRIYCGPSGYNDGQFSEMATPNNLFFPTEVSNTGRSNVKTIQSQKKGAFPSSGHRESHDSDAMPTNPTGGLGPGRHPHAIDRGIGTRRNIPSGGHRNQLPYFMSDDSDRGDTSGGKFGDRGDPSGRLLADLGRGARIRPYPEPTIPHRPLAPAAISAIELSRQINRMQNALKMLQMQTAELTNPEGALAVY